MTGTGQVIKELRKAQNLTQEQLAEMLGVRKSCIQKYENSSIVNLKLQTIRRLCELFRVPPYVFVFPEMWNVSAPTNEMAKDFLNLAAMYINLSEDGRQKAHEYLKDILEIPKYNGIETVEADDMKAILYAIHYQMIKEHPGQE